MALASPPEDQTDIAIVHKDVALEVDLARWLTAEARRLKTSPSVIVSALLEWARDENILDGDGDFLPGLSSPKAKRANGAR